MSAGATATTAPLLRSPPFPGGNGIVSHSSVEEKALVSLGDAERLFSAVRSARVGGAFCLPDAPPTTAPIIIRARSDAELESARGAVAEDFIAAGDVDPWSLLEGTRRLIAHGDDEWVALATIAGCPVDLLSSGRFGAPGDSADELRAHAVQALWAADFRNPFTGEDAGLEATIDQLGDWRRTLDANRKIVAACGMAWWKRREIARFLWSPGWKMRFFRSEARAIAHAAKGDCAVTVWPSRVSADFFERARASNVEVIRVEDGFIRSAGLGSNLVPPSSIAVDRQGIHYDPSRPSDLETLLATTDFPPALLDRAKALRQAILQGGIGKYGRAGNTAAPQRRSDRRLVLVPGQVEDDMSVRLGGGGLTSNLELLRRTRALEPDAEIWFRPHPDVDAGHRNGKVADVDALAFADHIVRGGAMAPLLDLADAVHVLTSLTGLEALMRDREVTCHGTPFYAGWGLTRDLAPVPERRGRQLTLDQLVAGVLILYPRYLDPVTGLPCAPELLIRRMMEGTAGNRLGWATRIRQAQGRLMKRLT